MRVKGLPLTVYYNLKYRNCANGGISERYEELILVATCDENGLKYDIDGHVEVMVHSDVIHGAGKTIENAVVLVKRTIGGKIVFDLTPYEKYHNSKWYMFGGNYAGTSDSRLGEAISKMGGDFYGALAVHDRTEG